MRPSQRAVDELRTVEFIRQFTKYAEGSVQIRFGDTIVLCNASITPGVPRFLKEQNQARNEKQGWLTAEYGMLPRATDARTDREAVRGKQGGRTQEIQRLIGRALRNCVNLKDLGEYTITIDCDVLQADGGTRTASITGGCVALYDALQVFQKRYKVEKPLFTGFVASISVGIVQNNPVLDLDYQEDSSAETDMNVVMNEAGEFIEVQGTAERKGFNPVQLQRMLELAQCGIGELIGKQKQAVGKTSF